MIAQTISHTAAISLNSASMASGSLNRTTPLLCFNAPLRPQRIARVAIMPRAARDASTRDKLNPAKFDPKYDPEAVQTNLAESAFTRRREVLVGRLAMTGFFAATVGELFSGKGALGQLALETHLPSGVIKALVGAIVIFNAVTALNPGGTTFSEANQKDIQKRPAGGVQDPNINIVSDPRKFLGISDSFGFTKKNEVFVGRVAMLGFAAELIGELAQGGKGPLGQLGLPMPMFSQFGAFGLAGWVLFFFAAAVGSGNFPGEQKTGEDIY